LGVCMCARDHNGNTTAPPSSAGSQSEHFHSNPTIFCRIYLGAYFITGKTRPHRRSIQFTGTDMSHLTYCPQIVAENRRSNTAKSKCGLSWWRTLQNNSKNNIFTRIFLGKNIKKWSILTFFLAMTVAWSPPQYHSGVVLVTACGCDFRGVTIQVDLTSWLDKLSLVKWFEG